jgi:nidogen-like/fibronectin type III domain protein
MLAAHTHPMHRIAARLALTLALAAAAFLLFAGTARAAIQNEAGCTTNTLARNDDGSTDASVPLTFSLNFYGAVYNSLWVNNNGNVTFTAPLGDFTPGPIVTNGTPIIAPFWGDVDTRAIPSDTRPGSAEVTYGNVANYNGTGKQAFCVMWDGVGYYNTHDNKLNRFQLLLVDQSIGTNGFDIVFNYDQIQWETGDASGGVNGLGGIPARVGFTGGVSSFELPGSGVPGAFLDGNATTGLTTHSVGSAVPGRYIFEVRNTPGPPQNFTAVPASGQVALTWTPPAYPGSSPIDHYELTYSPGGATPISISAAGPLQTTISGLTNGTPYTFSLVAVNTTGAGPAATAQATPVASSPSPPTNVHATASNASAALTWDASTVPVGSPPVTHYTATCTAGEGGATGTASTSPFPRTNVTVTGLTNGATYTCTVVAHNAAGPSAPSAPSNSFTPTTDQSATVIQPGVTNTLVTNNAQEPNATTTTTAKFNLPPTNDPNIVGRPAEIDTFDPTVTPTTVCAAPETCFGRVTHYNIPTGYGNGTNGPIKVTLVYDRTVVPFARLLTLRWWEIRTVGDDPNGQVKPTTSRRIPLCRLGRYNGTTCVIIWTVLPFARTVDSVRAGPFDLVAQFWLKTIDDPFLKGH